MLKLQKHEVVSRSHRKFSVLYIKGAQVWDFCCLGFSGFLYYVASMVGDFRTAKKKSKLFRFGIDFKVSSTNIFFGGSYNKKWKLLIVLLNPFASYQKDF